MVASFEEKSYDSWLAARALRNQNIWWPSDLCGFYVGYWLRHSAAAILPFSLHFCKMASLHVTVYITNCITFSVTCKIVPSFA